MSDFFFNFDIYPCLKVNWIYIFPLLCFSYQTLFDKVQLIHTSFLSTLISPSKVLFESENCYSHDQMTYKPEIVIEDKFISHRFELI